MLKSVWTGIFGIGGVNPAGGNGIDPDFSCQADRESMGKGGNASFGGGVAFRLGLAHPVSGGREIDDGCTGGEIGEEELSQIKGRGNAYLKSIIEFFVGAVGNPFHQRQRVVDQVIHMTVIGDYFFGKAVQGFLVRHISRKIFIRLFINDADGGSIFLEFFSDAFSDSLYAAGNDGNFMLKHHRRILLCVSSIPWENGKDHKILRP